MLKFTKLTIAVALFGLTATPVVAQVDDTVQHIVSNRRNSLEQQRKPYVILISADGFRHDYAEKHKAEHILALGRQGVTAAAMLPSFPSVTFPNHYTLVTGLYPSHHGLVNNTFWDEKKGATYSMSAKDKVRDSSWYGGTTLWTLAEQQQLLSASLFWVGSEAAIKGLRPTYYYNYNEKIPLPRRIQIVKDWLNLPEDRRPHLITFYLDEPDHSGHQKGPDAPETALAVQRVDSIVNQLAIMARETGLPVNMVLVADHGMTAVDRAHPLALPAALDTTKVMIPSSGTMVDVHVKNSGDILPIFNALKKTEKDYKVYLKTEMPASFHYGVKDDRMNRIGDILIIPEWPYVFSKRMPGVGYHGFDPLRVKDMHAVFYAWGPAFKSGLKIPAFENIHLFPMITEVLGLTYTDKIDGKKKVLKGILK